MGLFWHLIKRVPLIVITIGIYMFWVGPRIARWKWENTDFDHSWCSKHPSRRPRRKLTLIRRAASAGYCSTLAPRPEIATPVETAVGREGHDRRVRDGRHMEWPA